MPTQFQLPCPVQARFVMLRVELQLSLFCQGLVTGPCERGKYGPKRDCEFTPGEMMRTCATPGVQAVLQCTVPANSANQVLRICESSVVLGTGLSCRYNEALANVVLGPGTHSVSFKCPAFRSAAEPGGHFSTYYGAAIRTPQTTNVPITCV